MRSIWSSYNVQSCQGISGRGLLKKNTIAETAMSAGVKEVMARKCELTSVFVTLNGKCSGRLDFGRRVSERCNRIDSHI